MRSHDFEAGDWGLLDNQDRPSGRSRMLAQLCARLDAAYACTGRWAPAPPRAWVGISPHAQALEAAKARGTAVPGRLAHDGAHGAALLAVRLLELGISTAMAPMVALPERAAHHGELLVLSHVVAWTDGIAARMLAFAGSGGCLVIDATCGRKTLNGSLQRPWPGGLAKAIGLQVVDLETRPDGYELALYGLPAGRWLLARQQAELDPVCGWHAWEELRFAHDGETCVWERPYGSGRIVVVRGMLGPSQVHARSTAVARYILGRAGAAARHSIHPIGSHWATISVPVRVEHGSLTAVLAPDLLDRAGCPVRLRAAPGRYTDLWSGAEVDSGTAEEIALPADDGIVLLWQA